MGYIFMVLILALTKCLTVTVSSTCDDSFGYKPWKPSWATQPRGDLRCRLDDHCKNETSQVKSEEYDKCCTCRSCAVWEGKEIDLFIEYVSVLGRSLVLSDQAPSETDVYKIEHMNAEMTEIPSNLCDWDTETNLEKRYFQQFESIKQLWRNITKINFENNRIGKIIDLNCLERLDELNLRNNRLTHVYNSSFNTLTYLRYIDFSGNLIKEIDPGILTSVHLNLFSADFSHNKMSELDVSNMLSLYPFCSIDFQSNDVTKLVNKANFTLEMTKTYGPGFVSFKNNDFQEWPDFKELLNLDDITQMGHLFSFGFDFRDVPIYCDCHLESFMSLAKDVIKTVWRDYMNVTCTGPPDLEGTPVGKVDPERFICKLPANKGCPTPDCTCVDRPNNDTLFINCSYDLGKNLAKLNSLPKFQKSKFSNFISLDISGHNIANITNLTLLSNISMLNASHNNLVELNNDVAKALENATVDISHNPNLRELPKLFLQYRNVCTTYMKNLQIICDCDSLWIETWLHSKKCVDGKNIFTCVLPSGESKPALSFRASDVDCSPHGYKFIHETMIAGVIVFLIVTGTLIYTFRYELLILCVRMKQARRNSIMCQYHFDVFLSFNDDDINVMKWVDETLEDKLVDAGYRIFRPGHDLTFGAERDSEVLKTINETANFLLILSDSYHSQDMDGMRPWTENEWKYGWYNFLRDRHKNLIIINFDHVSSFDINHPQMKAFLRVGSTIDFKNHDRNIMGDICRKLGKPFYPPIINVKGFDNINPKLPKHLFCTTTAEEKFTDEQDTDVEANCRKLTTTQNFSKMRKRQNGQVKALEYDPRFACYYGNSGLKKTPHIPIFKKQVHKNKQKPALSTTSDTEKIEKQSKIYKLDVSTLKTPECTQKIPECTQKIPECTQKIPESKLKNPENYFPMQALDRAHRSEDEHLQTSSDCVQCGSTETESCADGEDEDQLFQLDMSTTSSLKEVSSVTNSKDSGCDTGSLGGISSTLTASIGSSTVSFHSDSLNGSMTEITV